MRLYTLPLTLVFRGNSIFPFDIIYVLQRQRSEDLIIDFPEGYSVGNALMLTLEESLVLIHQIGSIFMTHRRISSSASKRQ